ncbi:MAG: hypothetical protein KF833_18565 [Verrucomicrobiae bacterium]|nr:hypothetical protein [Verrucomicrobiae bacterium]
MKRGAVTSKTRRTVIALWLPDEILSALDAYVDQQDLDRSKVVRAAIKEKLGLAASPHLKEAA